MYPIPANKNLTLSEIADHWSREIQPSCSQGELTDLLSRAWWRAEFQSTGIYSRLGLLTLMFRMVRWQFPFWIKGEEMPSSQNSYPYPFYALPVPSSVTDTWTDQACNAAFIKIAEEWDADMFDWARPIVGEATLTEQQFTAWVLDLGYSKPQFWGTTRVSASGDSALDVDNKHPSKARKRGPVPEKLNRVKKAMVADLGNGKFTVESLSACVEEALSVEYVASRDTVRRARKEILLEFVEVKNSD